LVVAITVLIAPQAAAQSKSARFRIEFSSEPCSDTMSEAAFGRRVVVAVRNQLYTGCGLVR
jgi:uncharacterized membrane protein